VAAYFTSTSLANRWPARRFLRGPKRYRSLGPIPPTGVTAEPICTELKSLFGRLLGGTADTRETCLNVVHAGLEIKHEKPGKKKRRAGNCRRQVVCSSFGQNCHVFVNISLRGTHSSVMAASRGATASSSCSVGSSFELLPGPDHSVRGFTWFASSF
jgi:hypothetical protein